MLVVAPGWASAAPVSVSAAAGSWLSVQPANALQEGRLVTVRGDELSSQARTVWQCIDGALDADTDCEQANWTAAPAPNPDGAFTTTFAVTATLTTQDGRLVDCRSRSGACVIALAGLTPSPSGLIAGPVQIATPISLAPANPASLYRDPVFADATVDRDLVYVTRQGVPGGALGLDLYQPQGDRALRRPLIVWIHGGGYATGEKADMAGWARDWARRGFVTASIDYRLRPSVTPTDPAILDAAQDAAADARAALVWLRNHRTQYRIDPDAIVVAGESAGAATALEVSYHSTTGAVRPAAAVSLAGAIPSTVPVGTTRIPALMLNGTDDTINPLARAQHDCRRVRAAGGACSVVVYRRAGHGLDQLRPNIDVVMANFLIRKVLAPGGLVAPDEVRQARRRSPP